jgi:hypothetical protein
LESEIRNDGGLDKAVSVGIEYWIYSKGSDDRFCLPFAYEMENTMQ